MSHSTTIDAVPIKSIAALREAVAELLEKGIKCRLEEGVAPRNYYRNQMQKDFGQDSEECPFVLRLLDARFDVAFIVDTSVKDGVAYKAAFDDWSGGAAHDTAQVFDAAAEGGSNNKRIRDILGVPMEGAGTDHWNGFKKATTKEEAALGQLLQTYTKHAMFETAEEQGMMLVDEGVDENGEPFYDFAKVNV